MTRRELLQLLDLAERDLKAGLAKLTQFRAELANTPIPDRPEHEHRCPRDGLAFATAERLAEHQENVHP